jgi:hypothetical protein
MSFLKDIVYSIDFATDGIALTFANRLSRDSVGEVRTLILLLTYMMCTLMLVLLYG